MMPEIRSPRVSLANLLSEFRLLDAKERWILLQAAWLLPLRTLQLRAFGLNSFRTRPTAQVQAGSLSDSSTEIASARRTQWLLSVAANRGICRGSCLSRSLVLRDLLDRQNICCQIRIGVRHPGAAFEAHAWVEVEGVVVNDTPETVSAYAPIHSLYQER